MTQQPSMTQLGLMATFSVVPELWKFVVCFVRNKTRDVDWKAFVTKLPLAAGKTVLRMVL